MTYFEHTKRDLAEAKREAGELMLALADDTSRKMDHEEFDRTYLLEDLLTRMTEFAQNLGADPALFESLANFRGSRPAYDLVAAPAGETTQEIPSDRCPRCNHWPFSGSHGPQGCFATGGALFPCGCKYERPRGVARINPDAAGRSDLADAVPFISQDTIRQAAMLETWDGGYPRHAFERGTVDQFYCGRMIRPVYGAAEGSERSCGRHVNHEIHNLNPEA